jgi:hypothetical protein
MAFLKLKCDTAYATGAIRSNLDMSHLVDKMRRAALKAEMVGQQLRVQCGDEDFIFDAWESDGVGRIGWLQLKILGDVGTLSRKLSEAGIRHKFDYSRPRDLETSDVRSVTQYDYRWDIPGMAPKAATRPAVTMFDEQL